MNKNEDAKERVQDILYHFKSLNYAWTNDGVKLFNLSKYAKKKIERYLKQHKYIAHYTLIKDLNRLLYDQNKHKSRKYFCEHCLNGYSREDLLDLHKPDCKGIGDPAIKVEMPEEGKNKLKFQNYHRQMLVPFVIYAGFESLTAKFQDQHDTQNKATHKSHNFTRYVVTATLLYDVMVKQKACRYTAVKTLLNIF